MHIYSVADPEFAPYGMVWDDLPQEAVDSLLAALGKTPVPRGGKAGRMGGER